MSHWLPSPTLHLLCATAGLLVYSVSTRMAQLRRPPASAIAWVMGLALLPYVVLPLYLAFGQRKMKVRPSTRARRTSSGASWCATLVEAFGFPGPAPARVRFHRDGGEAREALWQVIEAARLSLDICTFLIGDDELGRELLKRLTRCAQRGARVRLMIDGAGLWLARLPSVVSLRDAGGEVKVFHPLFSLRRYGPRNLRNHRKLVVADGQWLWSGGRNLAAEYFCGSAGEELPWIDLSFDIAGAVVATAARQFALDWGAEARISATAVEDDDPGAESTVQYLPSGPDQAEDTVQALLLAACVHARDRLSVVTPYFVPDESLLAALRLAMLRGVRVTLVLPQTSNHRLADLARARPLRALANAGAQIQLVPRMVHAKAVVMDQTVGLSGSINLDSRSLLLNYEAEFVFHGAAEIAWLARWINVLAEEGAPFDARPPTLLRDVAEGLLLAIAFQL